MPRETVDVVVTNPDGEADTGGGFYLRVGFSHSESERDWCRRPNHCDLATQAAEGATEGGDWIALFTE